MRQAWETTLSRSCTEPMRPRLIHTSLPTLGTAWVQSRCTDSFRHAWKFGVHAQKTGSIVRQRLARPSGGSSSSFLYIHHRQRRRSDDCQTAFVCRYSVVPHSAFYGKQPSQHLSTADEIGRA